MNETEKYNPDRPPPPPLEAPQFKGLKKAFGDREAQMTAQASAVGLTFAVAIVLGLALGWWLDRKFGTAPWLLLVGLFLGIAAGFKNLFTVSARLDRLAQKAAEEKKHRRATGRPPEETSEQGGALNHGQ
ncbi:MAG: AtpZ/AtpI family protein [Candidatus Adiutrix sp.]|jgi:ATP synthase protein I|nr:AtpZ/AtpI family protein [Candidatus Adiutrix sp.]